MDVPLEVVEAGGETERLDALLEIGKKSFVAGTDSARQTPKEDVEAVRGGLSAGKDEFMALKMSWRMNVPKSWTHCSSRNQLFLLILPASSVNKKEAEMEWLDLMLFLKNLLIEIDDKFVLLLDERNCYSARTV